MSASDPSSSPTAHVPGKQKVDLVTAPCMTLIAATVIAGLGQSRDSELLLWQLPLALVAVSIAYVGFRARQARRKVAA